MPKYHFVAGDPDYRFVFDLNYTPATHKMTATVKLPQAFPGYGKTIKGVFAVNNAGEITSLKIFNVKGDLLVTYNGFADPTTVPEFLSGMGSAFGGSGDLYEAAYGMWNGFLAGSFKATFARSGTTDVGTGGTATVIGSKGNDKVVIFQSKDVVFNGGKGIDTVSFEPQNGDEPASAGAIIDLDLVHNNNPFGGTLTLTNVENLFGTEHDDEFFGNGLANRLDGGWGGIDQLHGRGGNDTLYFLVFDHIGVADGGEGTDTLIVDANLAGPHLLDLVTPGNSTGVFAGATVSGIEIFRFTGGDVPFAFKGTGIGETVYGGDGADDLEGNGGGDVLFGGRGGDSLTGGPGADRFGYASRNDSPLGDPPDTITDFNRAEEDRIDLRKIDANTKLKGNQAFTWIGQQAFHGKAGELQWFVSSGKVVVAADLNGDKAPDFVLNVETVGALNLVKDDFLL